MANGYGEAADMFTGKVIGCRLVPAMYGLRVIGLKEEKVGIGKEVTGGNNSNNLTCRYKRIISI
jgi:hypothetical protein